MFETRYYEVTKAFVVYERIAISPSETFIGASRIYGNVYRPLKLKPGDQLHELYNHTWYVVHKGKATPVRLELSEKHPFEKVYVPHVPQPPADSVKLFGKAPVGVTYHRPDVPLLEQQPGEFYGRSIDTVVPANFKFATGTITRRADGTPPSREEIATMVDGVFADARKKGLV